MLLLGQSQRALLLPQSQPGGGKAARMEKQALGMVFCPEKSET